MKPFELEQHKPQSPSSVLLKFAKQSSRLDRGRHMSIEIRHIHKSFGHFQALSNVTLNVADGELVALLGPSGSGKTTLLRIIAGLEHPDFHPESDILFNGVSVADQTVRERRIGFVFQHYALFRHMTVFENIAFGLRVRPRENRPSNPEIRERVTTLLKLIQLEGLAERFPSQLSGGQRQRVALARALAVQPKVLLLDEPFGALDAKVRQALRAWLRKLHDELHITSVLVTHDQDEAIEVADRVVIMNKGKIEQAGPPEECFHRPATPFVMEFLGNVNMFHARVRDGSVHIGDHVLEAPALSQSDEKIATVYLRPHELEIDHVADGRSCFAARVVRFNPASSFAKVWLLTGEGLELQIDLTLDRFRELALTNGDKVFVYSKASPRVFTPEYSI